MEILLALIFGAAVGAALHFVQPARDTRGTALAPILGALVGGLTWLAFTWAGAVTTSPWIWLASAAAPAVVLPVVLWALTASRLRHDETERARLRLS